ncbi:MAG: sodium ion-translocating decarboxylase subunit beta, partial [Kiritimatiellia bacterium]
MPGGLGQLAMILVGCGLIYLAIVKKFEPLLLLPIGFGGILANVPVSGIAEPGGMLYAVYNFGIVPPGLFPLLIFMG